MLIKNRTKNLLSPIKARDSDCRLCTRWLLLREIPNCTDPCLGFTRTTGIHQNSKMSGIITYVRVILISKRSERFKVEGENEHVSNKMSST